MPQTAPPAPPPPPPPPVQRSSQTNNVLPIGHNYQPVYTTSPDTYCTALPPVRPTSPMPAFAPYREPVSRPASPWPPHLDTGYPRSQSPAPMPGLPQAYGCDACPPPLQRPFAMPSPSSSMSSVSCFSMEDDAQTASSQSSYPATPFDESSSPLCPNQILPDQPLVEEPEDGLCCSHKADCKRSQSLKRQKDVQQAGYAMLWGPPSNIVRSCSS